MKSFEYFYEFSVCHYHLPFKIFDQTITHFIQGCFVPNLVEIGPVEKKFTMLVLSPLRQMRGPSFEYT